jgi:predicted secreted Zn-dependent protease
VSKFVGKFRKNKNYNDDYNYDNRRHRNEHSEIKKLLSRDFEESLYADRPERSPTKRTK